MPASANNAAPDERLIYVVDDEELLLQLAEAALINEGYSLKKFQDPNAALRAFENEPSKPLLLLTDYAMERMNGLELSARCKAACPQLKVLVVSGTAGPEIVLNGNGDVDEFVSKPYQPRQLAEVVRSLLARKSPE